jgi:hypothetical protein
MLITHQLPCYDTWQVNRTRCVRSAAGGATGFAIGGHRYLNLPADPAFSADKSTN